MFSFFKQLLAQSEPPFPRNRFAGTNWAQELAAATRRLCNESGSYAEHGAYTELELGAGAGHIVLYFKNEYEAEMAEILSALNEIDNQVQADCERAAASPVPEAHRQTGWTQERWRKAHQFSVSIVCYEAEPPQIDYGADHANSEFSVYLGKAGGSWQAFWDRELERPV
ncbi:MULTISPECIES: hypothetical protein [Eikenella]|uniref:Uncharacterized protein n=1 Tax=Eikenella longinqua TaxID=1795827 RepID=A0A1A9RWG5_9NEIS|nr:MULTISPECIES: hypothetical protein [Eikenella]OAM26382.1 hypothetical protein A7P95_09365 [Eikenella longinqua]